MLAVGVLWVFTGVLPLEMFIDAHTVPSGTVAGYDPISSFRAEKRGYGGRIAQVEIGGGTDRVHLDRRLNYPEAGDTLTVYPEDGVLAEARARAEQDRA